MAAKVLTTDSMLLCDPADVGPPRHGGTIKPSSTAKLTVKNAPVLVATDVMGEIVSTCTNASPPTGATKCSTVSAVTNTLAKKLTVGGVPVLLDPLIGTTDGAPIGTLDSDPNQDLLTAT